MGRVGLSSLLRVYIYIKLLEYLLMLYYFQGYEVGI